MSIRINSGSTIAKMLVCDGFNEETATAVRKYAEKQLPKHLSRAFENHKEAMKEVSANLPMATRIVLGKFIHSIQRMSFETGLRVGLVAGLGNQTFDIESADPYDVLGLRHIHDHSYWVEKETDLDEWISVKENIEDRAAAKQLASQIAKREKTQTRVLQGGSVVQRYSKRGTKQGGD